jgi:CMP-N,N'-diacetyllegionaminic acid synthase
LKFLIIIPARGGSKGIPKKNISILKGIPLIQHTIDAALEVTANHNDIKAIVSTDDLEIKKVALDSSIEVPFLRPKALSGDHSSSVDYILHAIEFYSQQNIDIENIIVLQPTSPLRQATDIVNAIDLFNNENGESLISVYEEHTLNNKITYKQDGKYGRPIDGAHNAGFRRQDDTSFLVRNGAIYITSINFIKNTGRIVSDKPLIFMMPKHRSVNIDTFDDLLVAKKMLS